MLTDQLHQVLGHLPELFRIMNCHFCRSTDGNSLEVFGTHHRAHAGPAVDVFQFVDHAGIAHQVFSGRSDQGDPRPLFLELLPDHLLGRARFQPPDLLRRPDLRLAVVDPQVTRFFRSTRDDHGVKAGEFQFRTPETAGLRLAVSPCQRRLGRHGKADHTGNWNPGNHGGGKDQDIVGRQRIDSRLEFSQQIVRSQPPASQVGPVNDLVRFLGLHRSRGQVHS